MQGKPCQDHALSVTDEHTSCAAISDGCSAGAETDMGARVLTFSAIAAMRAYHEEVGGSICATRVVEKVNEQQRLVLASVRAALSLARDDMLATCGYVYLTQKGGVAHLAGDGVIALKYRSGNITMYHYDWGKAPFYPQYREEASGAGYVREHGTQETDALTEEEWHYQQGSEIPIVRTGSRTFTVAEGMCGVTKVFSKEALSDEIDAVALFTDGVMRVENVEWQQVVRELLSFKTTAGQFVKRRLSRALKDFRELGKGPLDDIACAVVHVSSVTNEGEEHADTN